MADTISQAQRSRVMAKVRSKNTRPEIRARRAIHASGFRFRLHPKSLPGVPDIVLRRYQTVVFINGCFWHWHGCKASRMPSSNTDYWNAKIKRNVERDKVNTAALLAGGWIVETVWECNLDAEVEAVIDRLNAQRSLVG